MSFNTWNCEGFGFYTEEIKPEALYSFLKNHPCESEYIKEFIKELDERMKEEGIEASDLDIDDDFREGADYCLASLIGPIIKEETGLKLGEYGLDDSDCEALLFIPRYPWEFSEGDLKITSEKDIAKLLDPYAEELGVSGCQYIALTYSG